MQEPAQLPMMVTIGKAFTLPTSRWCLALALTFGFLVFVSLNVWTAPAGILWHAFHGRFARFGGEKVVVPWDMWVAGSNRSVTIIRQAAKYKLLNSPWGAIVLTRGLGNPTDLATDCGRIARAEEQPPEGFRLLLVREVRSGERKAYCWESSRIGTPELMISCHFDGETLSAVFRGSPKYSSAFYDAISRVTR